MQSNCSNYCHQNCTFIANSSSFRCFFVSFCLSFCRSLIGNFVKISTILLSFALISSHFCSLFTFWHQIWFNCSFLKMLVGAVIFGWFLRTPSPKWLCFSRPSYSALCYSNNFMGTCPNPPRDFGKRWGIGHFGSRLGGWWRSRDSRWRWFGCNRQGKVGWRLRSRCHCRWWSLCWRIFGNRTLGSRTGLGLGSLQCWNCWHIRNWFSYSGFAASSIERFPSLHSAVSREMSFLGGGWQTK